MTHSVANRFWPKVRVGKDCWEWTATTDGRYGLLDVDGRQEKAHRVSWRIHFGPIPTGQHVLHSCDNTICVKPSHLFLGTPADNAHDRDQKGRQVAPLGERSGMAKLTEANVRAIRASTSSDKELGRRFGVTATNIHYVRTRATWKHVQ